MKDPITKKLDEFRAIINATTVEPWELGIGGCIKGGPEYEYANGRGRDQILLAMGNEHISIEERDANGQFVVAAHTGWAASNSAVRAALRVLEHIAEGNCDPECYEEKAAIAIARMRELLGAK